MLTVVNYVESVPVHSGVVGSTGLTSGERMHSDRVTTLWGLISLTVGVNN